MPAHTTYLRLGQELWISTSCKSPNLVHLKRAFSLEVECIGLMINAHESLWIICSAVLWSIMAKEVPQSVKISLKAVLLSCEKSKGVKQTAILKDFYKLNNYKLDVSKYGYRDVYQFLLAVPDVARLEYSPKDGENRVFGVGGEGVFMSAHAKKAQGVPNGLKPLPPSEWPRNKAKGGVERTVVESKSSVKVTVPSDSKKKILPNAHGQYALHIKNLPLDCQEVRAILVMAFFSESLFLC